MERDVGLIVAGSYLASLAFRPVFAIAGAEQYDGFHGQTAVRLFPCFEICNLDLIIALAGSRCRHIHDHGAAHQSFQRDFIGAFVPLF
ncbi:MAG: hypothetical protein DKINENOH_03219 [bacterium]|nr:hypothetical protein [bacterium]